MGGIRRGRDQAQVGGRPADLRTWVLPQWLHHRLAAASLPLEPGVGDRWGRAWTPLGLPDDEARWTVDAGGALAPAAGRWSIDWWVGADDRWYAPSTEAGVRQRLVGVAPIVETRMWVPGGDVVVTHWAAPSAPGAPVVCVDIVNAGSAAVAVAVALRPWGPLGVGSVARITLEGDRLRADGQTVLWAQTPPRQAAFSDGSGGDISAVVFANAAPAAADRDIVDNDGWATAALIWPLVARATLRFEVGAGATEDEIGVARGGLRRRLRSARDRVAPQPAARPAGRSAPRQGRPSADDVARGWTARVDRSTHLELPAGPLATAIAVARRRLLLASASPADSTDRSNRSNRPAASTPRRDVALTVAALASSGCREEASVRLRHWLGERGHGGVLGGSPTATAATLWALGRWAGTGSDDDNLIVRSSVAVVEAAEAVGRHRSRRDRSTDRTALTDLVWTVAGLRSAAALLASIDEGRAASTVAEWAEASAGHLAESLHAAVSAAGANGAAGAGDLIGAAGAGDLIGAGLLGVQLGVLAGTDAAATAARRLAIARSDAGGVVVGGPGGGLSPYLTLLVAVSSILGGADPTAPLAWVLSVAGPTWTWPAVLAASTGADPRPVGVDPWVGEAGLIGDVRLIGDDPRMSGAWWALGRALLVDDRATAPPHPASPPVRIDDDAPVRLTLFPWIPADWRGQPVEVHGLSTAAGRASWALRWHGHRPALLWELEGPGPEVELRAPGIDAVWTGSGRRGEALLGL